MNILNNDDWIAFVAGDTVISILITPTNCGQNIPNNPGMQAALYEGFCNGPNIAAQCSCTTAAFTLTAPTTPGQTYFLVLDGCAGDICDYQIEVLQGSTLPVPPPPPVLVSPGPICQGSEVIFPVGNLSTWSVSPPTAGQLANVGGNMAQFTASSSFAGEAILCVTINNVCGLTSEEGCLTVDILPVDTTITYLELTVCTGECVEVGGQVFCVPGLYEIVPASSVTECDSLVELTLHHFTNFSEIIPVSLCPSMVYQFNGDSLWQPGVYTYIFEDANGCDSTYIIELEVSDTIVTEFSNIICTGEEYVFGGQLLTTAGTYQNQLLTGSGCDSIVYLHLEVVDYYEATIAADICEGDTFYFHGTPLQAAGIYFDTLTTTGGCDSIIELTLEVWPVYHFSQSATICSSHSFQWQGLSLTLSGSYTVPLETVNSCDSIFTLDLTVLDDNGLAPPSPTCPTSPSICAGLNGYCGTLGFPSQTVLFPGCSGGFVINNPDWLAFVAGDTVISILIHPYNCGQNVPNNPGMQAALYEGSCTGPVLDIHCDRATGPFTLSGPTVPGQTYYLLLDGWVGDICDYLIEVQAGSTLPVPPAPVLQGPGTVCETGTALFSVGNLQAGTFIWELSPPTAGILEQVGPAAVQFTPEPGYTGLVQLCVTATNACNLTADGCLTVNVGPLDTTFLEMTVCEGECLDMGGQTFCDPGVYVFALVSSATGCDSTVVLTLDHYPAFTENIPVSICEGEVFVFNGDTLVQSGTYTYVFDDENGCDSTIVLTLDHYPAFTENIPVSICEGEVFVFNGDTLVQSGAYTFVFDDANGCDSTVVLTLSIEPVFQTDTVIYVQPGTVINNIPIVEETLFSDTLSAQNGCDSIINQLYVPVTSTHTAEAGLFNLMVHPNPAHSSFFVSFSTSGFQTVQIEVLDVTGRKVLPATDSLRFSEGLHSLEIFSEHWASGVYIVRLKTQSGSASVRLIKA